MSIIHDFIFDDDRILSAFYLKLDQIIVALVDEFERYREPLPTPIRDREKAKGELAAELYDHVMDALESDDAFIDAVGR